MNFHDRLADIRARMRDAQLDVLIAVHDGAHFIEKPNPVMVVAGFKSLGPAAAVLRRDGVDVIATPTWDVERARERCPDAAVAGADDVVDGIVATVGKSGRASGAIGIAGLGFLPSSIESRIAAALPQARAADGIVSGAARAKTDEEIANAHEATRIAEAAYAHMLAIVRPGMSEDELAVELRWYTKTLGAEDNFLLLCAGARNQAVQPSTGRRFEPGDTLLAEITPSYRGQLAQICRTVAIGGARDELKRKYDLVVRAMHAGIAAAKPGAPMSDVCRRINTVLEAEGYGKYCHPPHIRRRGHGLGFGSIAPGDVALDNATVLEPGMVFMIHPNQFLPETGYLLCGEPVVITPRGAECLTRQSSALAEV
jgi:Xaa-Pro aminopeptidase